MLLSILKRWSEPLPSNPSCWDSANPPASHFPFDEHRTNAVLQGDGSSVRDVTRGFLTGLTVSSHCCPWSCLLAQHQVQQLKEMHSADLVTLSVCTGHPRFMVHSDAVAAHTSAAALPCATRGEARGAPRQQSSFNDQLPPTVKKVLQQVSLFKQQWAKAPSQPQTSALVWLSNPGLYFLAFSAPCWFLVREAKLAASHYPGPAYLQQWHCAPCSFQGIPSLSPSCSELFFQPKKVWVETRQRSSAQLARARLRQGAQHKCLGKKHLSIISLTAFHLLWRYSGESHYQHKNIFSGKASSFLSKLILASSSTTRQARDTCMPFTCH